MTIQSLLDPKSAEAFTIDAAETVKRAAQQMRQQGIAVLGPLSHRWDPKTGHRNEAAVRKGSKAHHGSVQL
jgi:hypothetical protein